MKDWLCKLLGHDPAACLRIFRGMVESQNAERSEHQAKVAELYTELRTRWAEPRKAEPTAEVAQLLEITGTPSLTAATGHVMGLQMWVERGPQLERENALLRMQLRSLSLQSMGTVDMMRVPVTDRNPPRPDQN